MIKLLTIISILLCIQKTSAQFGTISVNISTPNSYLLVNGDTTFISETKVLNLRLPYGTHIISNEKESHIRKKLTVHIERRNIISIKFEELVPIPLLGDSEKKIIVNDIDLTGTRQVLIRTYSSKVRYDSSNDKANLYTANLQKRFNPSYFTEKIETFCAKHKLVESADVNGFSITENNVNLDIIIDDFTVDQYKAEKERCSFSCKIRILDLRLNTLDSVVTICNVENRYGQVELEQILLEIIENLCSFVDKSKGKGLFKTQDEAKVVVNKKFTFSETQNISTSAEARKAVVTILTRNGHGSGCQVSQEGLVITNAHVIKGVDSVEVVTFFGDTLKGYVLDFNPTADLAVIRLSRNVDFVFGILNPKSTEEIGTEVFAIGSPLSPLLSQSISRGIISSRLELNGINYIQTDANVNGGNSGGALVDGQGNLLGIVNAKVVDFSVEGISFAIPVSEILKHFAEHNE